jgi:hypothetical protein
MQKNRTIAMGIFVLFFYKNWGMRIQTSYSLGNFCSDKKTNRNPVLD